MWANARCEGRPPNIGGASVECCCGNREKRHSGAITTLECRAVTLPISENEKLGHKVNFASSKILLGGKST